MEAAKLEAVTIDSGKVEEVPAPEETKLAAENTDAQASESSTAEVAAEAAAQKAKPVAKAYDSLEAILKAMTDHEEQLKTMKSQIQEMLGNSAVLRKSIKQIFTEAQKGNALEQELAQAKRKLSTLKNFLSTV